MVTRGAVSQWLVLATIIPVSIVQLSNAKHDPRSPATCWHQLHRQLREYYWEWRGELRELSQLLSAKPIVPELIRR
jgi:hypothetical protein